MEIWTPKELLLELCRRGSFGAVLAQGSWLLNTGPTGTVHIYDLSLSSIDSIRERPEKVRDSSHEELSTMDFAPTLVNDKHPALTELLLAALLAGDISELKKLTHYWVYFPDSGDDGELDLGLNVIKVEIECHGVKEREIYIGLSTKYPRLISSTALVLHFDPHLDYNVLVQALLVAGCAQETTWPLVSSSLPNGGKLLLYRLGSVSDHHIPDYVYRRFYLGYALKSRYQGHLQPADQVQHFSNQLSAFESQSIGQSPMPNFASPASSMTASSPASYMTARSAYASPAFTMAYGPSPAMMIPTIREDEPPDPSLPAPLQQIHNVYYQTLHQQNIIQPFDQELNWSRKGQHVTFKPRDPIPLTRLSHLGSSMSATVDKMLCRRIALARKTMRCSRQWTVADALREVYHLQNLRHHHIIQLVGTYLQGRNFSILMYPVADCHLGTFLEDATDVKPEWGTSCMSRLAFLASTLNCLSSAVAYIHAHTTKHMDIKPQNILIRETQRYKWCIYLADFGLSRSFALQDHSQTDGPTSRTPHYCSPEVYKYEQRGRLAGIFSLGCVFLEILNVYAGKSQQEFADVRRGTGDDESFHANLERVTNWIDELHAQNTDFFTSCSYRGTRFIPLDLIDIVARMIHQQPDQRPSASELVKFFASLSNYNDRWQYLVDRAPETEIQNPWTDGSEFLPNGCCASLPEPYEVYNP